jgi:hypothetical protein
VLVELQQHVVLVLRADQAPALHLLRPHVVGAGFRGAAERAAKLGIPLARLGRVDNVAGKFEAEFGNGTQSYVGTARVREK